MTSRISHRHVIVTDFDKNSFEQAMGEIASLPYFDFGTMFCLQCSERWFCMWQQTLLGGYRPVGGPEVGNMTP